MMVLLVGSGVGGADIYGDWVGERRGVRVRVVLTMAIQINDEYL